MFLQFIIRRTIKYRYVFYRMWLHIKPFLTWRILVCYLPFWFIATGWAWLFSVIGKGVLRGIAIGWLTFMWMPWCPEKLVTIPLAIWLHKKLFPRHSTAHLDQLLEKEKAKNDRKHKQRLSSKIRKR